MFFSKKHSKSRKSRRQNKALFPAIPGCDLANRHHRLRLEPLEDRRMLSVLSLSTTSSTISEGDGPGTMTAIVTRNSDTTDPLVVNLTSSDTTEATVPSSVTIPAGQASATFDIDAEDDAVVDGTRMLKITASSQLSGGPLVRDRDFSGDGKIKTDSIVNDIALLPDGKIVTASFYYTCISSNTFDFRIHRYNTDGTLDGGFGSGGVVNTDVTGDKEIPNAVVIQDDGKIVVAGYQHHGTSFNSLIVRYNSDGTLDTSFGGDGKVVADFSSSYNDIAIQPDGKILAGGNIDGDLAVARYNTDGSLDTSFGQGGWVQTSVGFIAGVGLIDCAYGIALQEDGKILLAGQSSAGNSISHFVLTRYTSTGTLDSSFGYGGKVITDISGTHEGAKDIAIQSDGKIVVVGSVIPDGSYPEYDFALARYNLNGTLDTSFGSDGTVITDFGGDDQAIGVAIQPNGEIVVVGTATAEQKAGLARYHTDGTLDMSDFAFSLGMQARGVAIESNGNVVLGGEGSYYSTNGFLARYTDTTTVTAEKLLYVMDNDVAGFAINPTPAPAVTLITTETGGSDFFTVALTSQPTANVSIGLSSSDDTEGIVSPTSLIFTPTNWGQPQTVTVTGVDDSAVDGNAFYSIITDPATSADGIYNGLNLTDLSVLNQDDEPTNAAPEITSLEVMSVAVGASDVTFTATYSDDVAISTGTIGTGDFLVTGPGGYSQYATLVSIDDNSDGTPRTATYRVTSSGQEWTKNNNGTYQISMVADQVSDTSGKFVPAGPLGTFTITVPNLSPTASIDSISPNPAQLPGDAIDFNGTGTDSDGNVVGWEWTSDVNGQLGSSEDFQISSDNLSVGEHTISFRVQDDDGSWSNPVSTTLTVLPDPSPTVESRVLGDGSSQRSTILSITLTFSDSVWASISMTDLVLENHSTGETIMPWNLDMVFDPLSTTATWSFSHLPGGRLPDGNYTATIAADDIVAPSGTPMTADYTFEFHSFFGDSDGDRDVDFADLFRFRKTYQKTSTDIGFDSRFDIDANSNIDEADLMAFRQNYLKALSPTPPLGSPIEATVPISSRMQQAALLPFLTSKNTTPPEITYGPVQRPAERGIKVSHDFFASRVELPEPVSQEPLPANSTLNESLLTTLAMDLQQRQSNVKKSDKEESEQEKLMAAAYAEYE